MKAFTSAVLNNPGLPLWVIPGSENRCAAQEVMRFMLPAAALLFGIKKKKIGPGHILIKGRSHKTENVAPKMSQLLKINAERKKL